MDGINSGDDFEEKENTFYIGIHCSFELYQLIPIPTYLSTAKKNEVGGVMTVEGPWTLLVFLFLNILYIYFQRGITSIIFIKICIIPIIYLLNPAKWQQMCLIIIHCLTFILFWKAKISLKVNK